MACGRTVTFGRHVGKYSRSSDAIIRSSCDKARVNCPQKARHFLGTLYGQEDFSGKFATKFCCCFSRAHALDHRHKARPARSWVKRCQYCFDRGDLTWLDPTYRLSATPSLPYVPSKSTRFATATLKLHASATFRPLTFVATFKIWQSLEYRCYPVVGHLRRRSLP